jgi:hypothetical protein
VTRTTSVLTNHQRLRDAWITLSSGPIIQTNASLGNHFRVYLTENATLEPPVAPHDGQHITWRFEQDTTGSRTLTTSSEFTTRGDLIAIDSAAGAVTYMSARYDGAGSTWELLGVQSISDLLDTLGSAQVGSILVRAAGGWTAFDPGTEAQTLTSHGAGADLTWET